ncbi:MAG TPA: glycosyltransferase [Panacibacter sp.]|nr:glycosyltransferase [Panacibacter sp.]
MDLLYKKKNQQYILDSFKELQNRGFNFQLYIVGDGPLRNQYQQFIDDNNLQGNVFLTGKKTDTCLRELYRKADFIIQATLTEGFGKVPLEGFFHGAIPLLNNIGLAGEMTGNGVRGFLFSAEKRNDLSNTILSCITHKEQLTRMISDGRVYAESITLESWVDSYLNIINTYFE